MGNPDCKVFKYVHFIIIAIAYAIIYIFAVAQKQIITMHTILITGGAGFIGSHLTRLFVTKYPDYKIVNLDKLTYAGNLENLKDIENAPNYTFVKGDITDAALLKELFDIHQFTAILHCAAESHVDRSITDPLARFPVRSREPRTTTDRRHLLRPGTSRVVLALEQDH